jgi:hypothetical protein
MARLAVDEWLCDRRPTAELDDWLVRTWRGDLGRAELPLPDERLDLVRVGLGTFSASTCSAIVHSDQIRRRAQSRTVARISPSPRATSSRPPSPMRAQVAASVSHRRHRRSSVVTSTSVV